MDTHRNDCVPAQGLAAPERPTSDEAPTVAAARGSRIQGKTDKPDCAVPADYRKALATRHAQAAMTGCSLHPIDDGGFELSSRGLSRSLPCLLAIGALLRLIGSTR